MASLLIGRAYRSEIAAAHARVRDKSTVFASPYGDVEYTQGGAGPDVLVIHGSGGGYDQGELMVHGLLGDGFHWIAPSRFGYLRSTFRPGATFDEQAHAYACLLDHLGVSRVVLVALSAGGPSALLFALLYPARTTSLCLVSCRTRPMTADEMQADRQGRALLRIIEKDWRYWLVARLFRKPLMTLMGANRQVIARLSVEQQATVDQVIDYMNPSSLRYAGSLLDHDGIQPGERIAAIRAPTLIIHAHDDTLQPYGNALYALATIPGADLLSFETGGHLVMVTEQAAVRSAVQRQILERWSGAAAMESHATGPL